MTKTKKSRYWSFIFYPEVESIDILKDILTEYHVPCAISPLHDRDINSDNTPKKPHYHVLISYGNTTTGSNIEEITNRFVNATLPIPVMSCKGYYRYLTHKDNPEKAQYKESDIIHLSGFDPSDYWSFTAEESVKIRLEIQEIIKSNRISEYFGLLDYLAGYDLVLYKYATDNTILFNAMCRSFKGCIRKD